jgi:spoIIIJ-associated protein
VSDDVTTTPESTPATVPVEATVSEAETQSGYDISTEEAVASTETVEGAGDAGEPEGPADSKAEPIESGTGTGAAPEDEGEELVDEGEVAADYLEGLLDIADLDGDIDITVENDRAAVSVIEVNEGDLQHLVGRDGKVLSALQDLTRLAVTRETGHRSRLMLDIAGHRATRRSELQRIAQQAITEAKESGEAVRMAAMSAFERKVVHDEVAAVGMSSESEGTDPNRHVVITPA